MKLYIKNVNDFLTKLQNLPKRSDDIIVYTLDVVGLYPNIANEEGLRFLREASD